MDDQMLQELVEEISLTFFKKPFIHKAFFNPRLRTTGGRYMLHTHNIEINKHYYNSHGMDELIGIIKHELCHYHLHLNGKGYKHGDLDFKQLLKEVGAPRFCTPIPGSRNGKSPQKNYLYECSTCHFIYKRRRKINTTRYVCGKCRGKLIMINFHKEE